MLVYYVLYIFIVSSPSLYWRVETGQQSKISTQEKKRNIVIEPLKYSIFTLIRNIIKIAQVANNKQYSVK